MACLPRFPLPLLLARALFLLVCAALAAGCGRPTASARPVPPTGPGASASAGLMRANPGYVQWLERQTLLRKAPELTAIVTGSSLPWNAPSTVAESGPLLDKADVWLDFNPRRAAWESDAPALDQLSDRRLPGQWAEAGVRGVFLSAAAESGAAWDPEGAFAELGRDTVSFHFAPAVGDDNAYASLEEQAAEAKVLLGGEAPPAATGLGPDFFLAARGVRDYPGLYLMVEVPAEAWPLLPLSLQNAGNAGRPLGPDTVSALARRSIIPPAFAQDLTPLPGRRGGWAATSEIVGVDGAARRWIYRYAGSPRRPVLNWDDPSGAARRVLAAGIIRQVGLLHQPLVGLSVEALWGQDPAPAPSAAPDASHNASGDARYGPCGSPEPALSALRALAREVRRYGSWSLLRDRLPARLLPVVQAAGVDFAADTVLSPGLEYALLSGDTAPLNRAIDASLDAGVDHARLWRQPPDGTAVTFAPDAPGPSRAGVAALPPAWRAYLSPDGERLGATATALAAVATGLAPERALALERLGGWSGRSRLSGADETLTDDAARVRAAHVLQVAFRALQPGLLFVSGQDLSGALFAPAGGSPPAWTPDGSARAATPRGLPVAVQIYPPLAAQLREDGFFAAELRRLADLRRRTGVAEGRLTARADMAESATTGVLTALPDGDYLLMAGNFSNASLVTDVRFPSGLVRHGEPGTDLVSGRGVAVGRDHLRLRMEPWQYRAVLLRAAEAPPSAGTRP